MSDFNEQPALGPPGLLSEPEDRGDGLSQINNALRLAAMPGTQNPEFREAVGRMVAAVPTFPGIKPEDVPGHRRDAVAMATSFDDRLVDQLAELESRSPGGGFQSDLSGTDYLVNDTLELLGGQPLEAAQQRAKQATRANLARKYKQFAREWEEGLSDQLPSLRANGWLYARLGQLEAEKAREREVVAERHALDPRNLLTGIGAQVQSVAELRNPFGAGGVFSTSPATDSAPVSRPVARFAERFGAEPETTAPPASFFETVDPQTGERVPGEPITAAAELGGAVLGEAALYGLTAGAGRAVSTGRGLRGLNEGRRGLPVMAKVGEFERARRALSPAVLAERGIAGRIAAEVARDVPKVVGAGAVGRGLRSEEFLGEDGALDIQAMAADALSAGLEAGVAQGLDELAPLLASRRGINPRPEDVAAVRAQFRGALDALPDGHPAHLALRDLAAGVIADGRAQARERVAQAGAGFLAGYGVAKAEGEDDNEALVAGLFFAALAPRGERRSPQELLDGLEGYRRVRGRDAMPGAKPVRSAREAELALLHERVTRQAADILERATPAELRQASSLSRFDPSERARYRRELGERQSVLTVDDTLPARFKELGRQFNERPPGPPTP